jgi:glutamate synthase domain-containing protein 3
MSGGIAYVYDADGNFPSRCNPSMVDIEDLTEGEREEELLAMLHALMDATGSALCRTLLKGWAGAKKRFAVVFPKITAQDDRGEKNTTMAACLRQRL